jgi:hydrogenase expression/formation protein HypC
MASVDFGGVTKSVCLAYVPEVVVGDYTIVHAGFAITQLDEASALETLALFNQMGVLEEELLGEQTAGVQQLRESAP